MTTAPKCRKELIFSKWSERETACADEHLNELSFPFADGNQWLLAFAQLQTEHQFGYGHRKQSEDSQFPRKVGKVEFSP